MSRKTAGHEVGPVDVVRTRLYSNETGESIEGSKRERYDLSYVFQRITPPTMLRIS